MRRRVYRLYQPITVIGLELWQLLIMAIGFVIGLKAAGEVHPAVQLVLGAVVGYLTLFLSERLKERYPGGALFQEITWLSQADHYVPDKDSETTPLRT